jgi:hypothetical protein
MNFLMKLDDLHRHSRNRVWGQRVYHVHPLTGWRSALAILVLVIPGSLVSGLSAQEAENTTEVNLAANQQQLADQLVKLESLLLRSADLESVDNPTRAALLQQAVAVSKQSQLVDTLLKAAKNLSASQLSEAVENQKISRDTLKRLLELLQSENREQRVREQRDQVRRWIEETDRLLRMQSSLRGRTEGGQALDQAAEDQGRLSQKAQQISGDLKQLNQSDSSKGQSDNDSKKADSGSGDSESSKPQPPKDSGSEKSGDANRKQGQESQQADDSGQLNGDPAQSEDSGSEPSPNQPSRSSQTPNEQSQGQQSQGQQSQGQQSQGQQSQGEQSQGQQSQGEQSQGQQSQGQQSQGQQSQGQQSQGQQSGGNSPDSEPKSATERAQQQIQQAQQNMQQAQQALEDAQREGAVEKQREAERNLKEAIEQLEQILNQLREEEIQRSLETLETRLRRMLDMQNKVLEETNRLHEIAGDQPDRSVLVRATALARDQAKVGAEGERALLLLQEEGSSAAFPEALSQVNRDIASATSRLETGDVGAITVVIQADIVQALEEMVEAVDRVRKENDQKKRQQGSPSGSPMPPGMQPLIDQLAELRLIRTLQLRVNKRTDTLSQMLSDPSDTVGQAKESDLVEQLKELGKRQESIEQVTRNIATGP